MAKVNLQNRWSRKQVIRQMAARDRVSNQATNEAKRKAIVAARRSFGK